METTNIIPFNMWDRPSVPAQEVPVLDGLYERVDGCGDKTSYLFREGKFICMMQQLKLRDRSSLLRRRFSGGSHDTPSTSGTSHGSPSTIGASHGHPSTTGSILADRSSTRVGDDDALDRDASTTGSILADPSSTRVVYDDPLDRDASTTGSILADPSSTRAGDDDPLDRDASLDN